MNDRELLQRVDGIGPATADAALAHFEGGREAAQSACRFWNEWTKVPGVSERVARTMFDRMQEADVFHELRGY